MPSYQFTFVQVLVLRNYGLVAMGCSIEEAFFHTFHLLKACEIQVCVNQIEYSQFVGNAAI